MHRLCTLLGLPQHRFASIHVVGTNGKSSVTRMVAALLEAHGVSAGACVSPHPVRWSERVLLNGREVAPEPFEVAVERTARAAEAVNRGLREAERRERAYLTLRDRSEAEASHSGDDQVTQFEVATAAAFVAFATAHVEAAVVEAGLGGRLDATNTIPSKVTVLTSIGLDHTEWLGETEVEIAAEKLAVLRDHTTLVLGRVGDEVAALARKTATERGAELIVAADDPGEEIELRAAGGFQRRNFALASAAAEAFLGKLDRPAVAEVAATLTIPGRLERVAEDPPTLLDVAHNPQGAAALADALPEISGGLPIIACIAILAEKDARAMIAALAPAVTHLICTQLPADGPETSNIWTFQARRRTFGADELAGAAGDAARAGIEVEAVEDFAAAVSRAAERASALGGMLLITGSHYVLAPARNALGLWQD
jgi:dihydrofolate synthase / folylpolyglutamate synthase